MNNLLAFILVLLIVTYLPALNAQSPTDVLLKKDIVVVNINKNQPENGFNVSDWVLMGSLIVSMIAIAFTYSQLQLTKEQLKLTTDQLKETRKTVKSNIVVDLYNDYRTEKWVEYRKRVHENIGKEIIFDEYRPYSYLFNHYGFLLEHGFVDVVSIYDMMGKNVFNAWDLLSPYILKVRVESKEFYPFQYHFEYLYHELRKIEIERSTHIKEMLAEYGSYDLVSQKFTDNLV